MAKGERLVAAASIFNQAISIAQVTRNKIEGDDLSDIDFAKWTTIRGALQELDAISLHGYWEISLVIDAKSAFERLCESLYAAQDAIEIKIQVPDSGVRLGQISKSCEVVELLCDQTVRRLSASAKKLGVKTKI